MARRLFDARTVVCASPAYLERCGVPRQPADLEDHACLVYGNLPDPYRWVWRDDDGRRQSVEIRARHSVNSGDFLCAAAAAGLGLVIQPTFIAHASIRRGELVPVLADFHWPVTPAYAIYPPTRHLSYRVPESMRSSQ